VPPVKIGLFIDTQGVLDLVQALLFQHKGQVGVYLVFLVQPRHPSARIFGKASLAGLDLQQKSGQLDKSHAAIF